MILDCWKRAWEQLIEFKMAVVNQESDPLIVQIVAGSEMIVLVGYELYIGETVGSMNMCVPLMLLNPILDQISSQASSQRKMSEGMARATRARIIRTVKQASVPVEPILGVVSLLLTDIARLQVGDVVPLDTNHLDPIPVRVGGVTRFLAKPGRRGGRSSVQIVSIVRD